MTTTINASPTNGLVQTADGSGILKVQSNGVTTNALAWVNFNGTTSPGTIRSAYNVGSVTKIATGDYVINFTTALSDANYAITGSASITGATGKIALYPRANASQSTSACAVTTASAGGGASSNDSEAVAVAIFGN